MNTDPAAVRACTGRSVTRRARAVLLLGALGALALGVARVAVAESTRLWQTRLWEGRPWQVQSWDVRSWEPAGSAFGDLVEVCALVVLAAAAGWLLLGACLTVATQALHRSHGAAGRFAQRMTPRLVRGILGGACGAAVLAAPAHAAPAHAAPAHAGPVVTAAGVPHASTAHASASHCRSAPCTADRGGALGPGLDGFDGLPLPERPVVTAAPPIRTDHLVVVQPGDCLWTIAARHLPAHADDAAVAAAWPVWFRLNRARVGPDPHLIHPRTRLLVPRRFR